MALTEAFYEAVNSNNIRRIRIMMQNSMLSDHTFEEFHEMEKAAAFVDGLYDKHDGGKFVEDRDKWNDDYMDSLMVDVIYNFSHERIEHSLDVVRYLRPVEEKAVPQVREEGNKNNDDRLFKRSYQEEKRRDMENGDYRGAKIGMGAVAGAAVGGVAVAVAGATAAGVAGGVVVGGVVGGAVTAVIVNGGN